MSQVEKHHCTCALLLSYLDFYLRWYKLLHIVTIKKKEKIAEAAPLWVLWVCMTIANDIDNGSTVKPSLKVHHTEGNGD